MARLAVIDPTRPQPSSWTETDARKHYSAAQLQIVKEWEIVHEFDTQGMNRAVFGPQGEERGWNNRFPFMTSPQMLTIPSGTPGVHNGKKEVHTYFAFIWYHLQLILNNSNKKQYETTPIDWPYVQGFIKDMTVVAPQAGVSAIWIAKGFQIQENGIGPEVPSAGWTSAIANVPWMAFYDIVRNGTYSEMSNSERNAMLHQYLAQWNSKVKSFSVASWRNHKANVNDPVETGAGYVGNFPSRVYWMLKTFKEFGMSNALLGESADWAATIWPNFAWRSQLGL
jgi:hypothetical protein